MRFGYWVSGLDRGGSAFLPVPAVTGAVLDYKGAVTGQPGTRGVPAPKPELTGNDSISGYPFAGGYSNSGAMPPVWYPNLYYQEGLTVPGYEVVVAGRVASDNQMPVPAKVPLGVAGTIGVGPKFMGQTQVQTKRGVPRFPDWLPRPGFGS
jgi:hypothetical protein